MNKTLIPRRPPWSEDCESAVDTPGAGDGLFVEPLRRGEQRGWDASPHTARLQRAALPGQGQQS